MAISMEGRGTVTGEFYCSKFGEQHRTAYVVGMVDMLGHMYRYAAPEHKPRIDAALRFVVGYENVALTRRFDEYIAKRSECRPLLVPGTFLTALGEWSGFDSDQRASSSTWLGRLFGQR